jgi:SGNH domain (fused to AT3 domains)
VDGWTAPGLIALIFLLAALTNQYIEQPLKNGLWSSSKLQTIGAGLCAVALSIVIIGLLGAPLKGRLYAGVKSEIKNLAVDPALSKSNLLAREAIRRCNLTPDVLAGADYQKKPELNQAFFTSCLAASQPKIILVGDSFSEVVAPHIALMAREMGYEFKILMGYGCPFPFSLQERTYSNQTSCRTDISLVRQQILDSLNAGDIAVLRLDFSKSQYIKIPKREVETQDQDLLSTYDSEIKNFAGDIEKKQAKLLVIGSNIKLESAPACSNQQWFNRLITKNCNAGVAVDESYLNQFTVYQDQYFVKKFKAPIEYFSLIGRLCDVTGARCTTSSNGSYFYSDETHLNLTAIDMMANDLRTVLHRLAVRS